MGKRGKATSQEVMVMIEMKEAGASNRDIADRMNIPIRIVSSRLYHHGLKSNSGYSELWKKDKLGYALARFLHKSGCDLQKHWQWVEARNAAATPKHLKEAK